MLPTGEMLKVLKAFWVLPPPFGISFWKNASHWGNFKNVKNSKGIPTKEMLPTGEMLKMLKAFWVLAPLFFLGGGGVKAQKTFNILTFLTFPLF